MAHLISSSAWKSAGTAKNGSMSIWALDVHLIAWCSPGSARQQRVPSRSQTILKLAHIARFLPASGHTDDIKLAQRSKEALCKSVNEAMLLRQMVTFSVNWKFTGVVAQSRCQVQHHKCRLMDVRNYCGAWRLQRDSLVAAGWTDAFQARFQR